MSTICSSIMTSLFILFLSANSCDKSSVDLSKLTLLDFMLQLHEITYGCVIVPFLLL